MSSLSNQEMATEIVEILELLVEKPDYQAEVLGNYSLADLTAEELPLSQQALRGKLKLAQVYLHQLSILKNEESFKREEKIRDDIHEITNVVDKANDILDEEQTRYGVTRLNEVFSKVKVIQKYIDEGYLVGTIEVKHNLQPAPIDKVELAFLYSKLIAEKRIQQNQNRIQQRYLKKLMKCLSSDADFELHIKKIQDKIEALNE